MKISCSVHDRWTVPRDLLLKQPPAYHLEKKQRRLVAEWLAKRYIRAAFPSAFDSRWRTKQRNWRKILKRYSEWLQAVYMQISTLDELPERIPYVCDLLLAVPVEKRDAEHWHEKRTEIVRDFQNFWDQFKPDISLRDVDVRGTDEITLAEIESYQRFDADWVSFEDDTQTTPPAADMSA